MPYHLLPLPSVEVCGEYALLFSGTPALHSILHTRKKLYHHTVKKTVDVSGKKKLLFQELNDSQLL